MYKKIHANSSVSEINSTVAAIIRELEKGNFSSDGYLMYQLGLLRDNNFLLTQAIKEKKLQSILGPLDKERDDALRVIFREVHAKILWRDAQVKAAARRLNEELEKYGYETIELAYADESSNINALLEDLKKPDVVEAISKLYGMSGLITQLETDQRAFEEAFDESAELNIANKKTHSATKLSKLILKQVNKETMLCLTGSALSKPEIYKDCLEKINEIIEINNKKVRERLDNSDDDDQQDNSGDDQQDIPEDDRHDNPDDNPSEE